MFNWFKKKEVEKSDPVVHKASGALQGKSAGVDISGRYDALFVVLEDFAWVKNDGTIVADYAKGMTYKKRKGNLALQELLPRWEQEGKVKVMKARK
jgi:hypothetical protein